MCRSCLNFIFHSPFNINIPSDYVGSAGRVGGFGLGDDWQIHLRGRIRAGLCGCKEDTDCSKMITLIIGSMSSYRLLSAIVSPCSLVRSFLGYFTSGSQMEQRIQQRTNSNVQSTLPSGPTLPPDSQAGPDGLEFISWPG